MLSKRFVELFIFLALLLPALLIIAGAGAEPLPLDGQKICLDPGHGGSDPGAINTLYNLEESDINLEVSYGLRYLLEGAGATVVMARSGDQYLTNSDRYTFCNEQQADILISVHTNSHTDTSWDGSMTLYGPRESPELAQTIHEQMYPTLRDTRPPQIPVEDFIDYGLDHFASGVLFKSDMPAAMIEPLLMSNTYEGPLLVDQIFANFDPANFDYGAAVFNQESCAGFSCRRGQIATAVFQGALVYFDNQSGGAMHVQAIDMSYLKRGRTYAIDTAVTIVDAQGEPLPAAEVTLQVTFPGGAVELQTALTGADGVAALRTKSSAAGLYEAEVLDVTREAWTYASAQNVETSEFLTIP